MTASNMVDIYEQEGWTSHASDGGSCTIVLSGVADAEPTRSSFATSSVRAARCPDSVMIEQLTEIEAQALAARFVRPLDLLRHIELIETEVLERFEHDTGIVVTDDNRAILGAMHHWALQSSAASVATIPRAITFGGAEAASSTT